MSEDPTSLESWTRTVPTGITGDSLWKVEAYRLSLYLSDLAWQDVTRLGGDPRTGSLASQLYRACGSIGANIAEGYSRGTARDRARFYEYSLGSARETRDWYFKGRHVLGPDVTAERLKLLASIIRLLLAMVPQQRGSFIRDGTAAYVADDNAEYLGHDTGGEHRGPAPDNPDF